MEQSPYLTLCISRNAVNFDVSLVSSKGNNGAQPDCECEQLIYKERRAHCEETCIVNKIQEKIVDLNKLLSLTLSNCKLTNLPDCFEVLRVKKLDISHNYLNDVPFCLINGLKCVEDLNVSYNVLTHFEIELKCNDRIETLNLSCNKVRMLPLWIFSSKCRNLKTFTCSFNRVTNNFKQQHINNKLQYVDFTNCMLMQEHLESVKLLPYLQTLRLGNESSKMPTNCFLNCDTLFLRPLWLESICKLDLQNLGISSLPNELSALCNLEEINLEKNSLNWLPESLTTMSKLCVLNISKNLISYLPKNMYQMNLKRFLASCNYLNSVPKQNSALIVLDVYDNCIDYVYEDINNVQFVDIDQNYYSGDNIVDYVNKRNGLRAVLNCGFRVDGIKVDEEKEPTERSFGSLDDSSCDNYGDEEDQQSLEEELWTVEKRPRSNDITTSDDEWIGTNLKKPLPKKMLLKSDTALNTEYESYFFVDVD